MNKLELIISTSNTSILLTKLYSLNIDIYSINISNNNINIVINEIDYDLVSKLSNDITIVSYKGIKHYINLFSIYKALIISIFIGIILLIILSNMIFDIEIVSSNNKLNNIIYSELSNYNIKKYKFKKSSTYIKEVEDNIVNNNKDIIEWISIKSSGTKYIINVIERKLDNVPNSEICTNIISLYNGTIKKINTYSGLQLVDKNTYVNKGDTLITGIISYNDEVKDIVDSDGYVYASVWKKVSIKYPYVINSYSYTGNSKLGILFNFFNSNYVLNKYDDYVYSSIYSIKNNIIPVSVSLVRINEIYNNSSINTYDVLSNGISYVDNYINNSLKNDEYIINKKILKKEYKEDYLYLEMYYNLYLNIYNKVSC